MFGGGSGHDLDGDIFQDEDSVSCFCDFCGCQCDVGHCLIKTTPFKKRLHCVYFLIAIAILGLLSGLIYLAVTRNSPVVADSASQQPTGAKNVHAFDTDLLMAMG